MPIFYRANLRDFAGVNLRRQACCWAFGRMIPKKEKVWLAEPSSLEEALTGVNSTGTAPTASAVGHSGKEERTRQRCWNQTSWPAAVVISHLPCFLFERWPSTVPAGMLCSVQPHPKISFAHFCSLIALLDIERCAYPLKIFLFHRGPLLIFAPGKRFHYLDTI